MHLLAAVKPRVLTVSKVHSLTYHLQAWHLVLEGRPLFDGRFVASPEGPLCPDLPSLVSKDLYSEVSSEDFSVDSNTPLTEEEKLHIGKVLYEYREFSTD
jgi:uncharacterized phage-associated protein